jgi:hypothetical protein
MKALLESGHAPGDARVRAGTTEGFPGRQW